MSTFLIEAHQLDRYVRGRSKCWRDIEIETVISPVRKGRIFFGPKWYEEILIYI
jgi:hypothetical protein